MWDWDEDKRQANLAKHGVDFAGIWSINWASAKTQPDLRHDYGEQRFMVFGLIGERLYVAIYTPRGVRQRLISLRKANAREVEEWLT